RHGGGLNRQLAERDRSRGGNQSRNAEYRYGVARPDRLRNEAGGENAARPKENAGRKSDSGGNSLVTGRDAFNHGSVDKTGGKPRHEEGCQLIPRPGGWRRN